MSTGDDETALATIAEGLEALPGNQQLLTQKVLVLDRNGRRTEANRVVQEIAVSDAPGVRARERYNRWPVEWFAPVRESVRSACADALSPLDAALSAPEGESDGGSGTEGLGAQRL
jgi:hypothetical protein